MGWHFTFAFAFALRYRYPPIETISGSALFYRKRTCHLALELLPHKYIIAAELFCTTAAIAWRSLRTSCFHLFAQQYELWVGHGRFLFHSCMNFFFLPVLAQKRNETLR